MAGASAPRQPTLPAPSAPPLQRLDAAGMLIWTEHLHRKATPGGRKPPKLVHPARPTPDRHQRTGRGAKPEGLSDWRRRNPHVHPSRFAAAMMPQGQPHQRHHQPRHHKPSLWRPAWPPVVRAPSRPHPPAQGAGPLTKLLVLAPHRPGDRRVAHRRLGPSSSAMTSTTDRALPSSAVQVRCWSRPTAYSAAYDESHLIRTA